MWELIAWIAAWIGAGIFLFRWSKRQFNTNLTAWFMAVAGGFVASLIIVICVGAVADAWKWMTAPPPPPSAADMCRDDWHHCTDNAMLVNTWKGEQEATRACELAADDQAKWGH